MAASSSADSAEGLAAIEEALSKEIRKVSLLSLFLTCRRRLSLDHVEYSIILSENADWHSMGKF